MFREEHRMSGKRGVVLRKCLGGIDRNLPSFLVLINFSMFVSQPLSHYAMAHLESSLPLLHAYSALI